MRILLIGKKGQLGWELERALATLGSVRAVDLPEIDLTQAARPSAGGGEMQPDVVVNAAAYTAVDSAESEENLARRVNGEAPGILASEAARLGAAFIHYSTDYVFDGKEDSPLHRRRHPSAAECLRPDQTRRRASGRSGGWSVSDLAHSWVYSLRGAGFVAKVLGWARTQDEVRVAEDEVSCPTWARMLAQATAQIARGGRAVGGAAHQGAARRLPPGRRRARQPAGVGARDPRL